MDVSQVKLTTDDANYYLWNSNTVRESVSRNNLGGLLTTVNNVTHVVPIVLYKGDTVTSLSFCTGATGATLDTDAHWLFGLYSSAGAKLGASADQTTTAWAANTLKTKALTTPYVVTTTGFYYASLLLNAGTLGVQPTMAATSFGALVAGLLTAVAGLKSGAPVPVATAVWDGTATPPATLGSLTPVATGAPWAAAT